MYPRPVRIASWVISMAAGIAALLLLTLSPRAENTVEDWSWTVDHFERFGIWDSVCDHRDDDGTKLRRCYVSYVDVYSPGEQFGAAFVFLTASAADGDAFEFRFEPGTQFAADGFRIERGGRTAWRHDDTGCLKCIIEGEAASALIGELDATSEIVFAFADRYKRTWERRWEAEGLAEAIADWRKASAERDLP